VDVKQKSKRSNCWFYKV